MHIQKRREIEDNNQGVYHLGTDRVFEGVEGWTIFWARMEFFSHLFQ